MIDDWGEVELGGDALGLTDSGGGRRLKVHACFFPGRLLGSGVPLLNMKTDHLPRLSYCFTNIRGEEDMVFECCCCRLPTIVEPGGFEICAVCDWEDDDTPGVGANHCSLEEAQANFRSHKHMYALDDAMTTNHRRNEFLDTCIALLTDFKNEKDARSRGILFAAFVVESEWL